MKKDTLNIAEENLWPANWLSFEDYHDGCKSEREIAELAEKTESELRRELPEGHILNAKKYRVIGVNEDYYDDFLFEVYDAEFRYAFVHLTWRVETDPMWPSTGTYRTWKEFYDTMTEEQ